MFICGPTVVRRSWPPGYPPWQYVRAVGEDVVACELIVPAFHRLRPPDLGAILAGGIMEIEVLARPEVMIIPSGSEIVSPEADRDKGDVPDFNSSVVSAYLQEWGEHCRRFIRSFPMSPRR